MTEMVLVLPLLVFVLALLLLFGRAWVRVQHATVMDRYEAWRQAAHAPGPHAVDPGPNEAMNQMFFAGNADEVEYQGSRFFPPDATEDLADWAGQKNPDTREFIEMVTEHLTSGTIASNPLAEVLRRYYLALPGYAGPEVPLEWADSDG